MSPSFGYRCRYQAMHRIAGTGVGGELSRPRSPAFRCKSAKTPQTKTPTLTIEDGRQSRGTTSLARAIPCTNRSLQYGPLMRTIPAPLVSGGEPGHVY